jgi:hypothetical protein
MLRDRWIHAKREKFLLPKIIISLFVLVVTMLLFSRFTQFVEMRQGVQLSDPFLSLIPAIDLTWPIFSIIYGSIILGLSILLYYPERLVLLFGSYALMVMIRTLMMYLVPLDTPAGMIFLQDPFVSLFVTGKTLTRDLFFSGHTATMFLLFLAVPKKFKTFFFIATLFVGGAVLFQKVHYTIDVVVAPFVSYVSYCIVERLFD